MCHAHPAAVARLTGASGGRPRAKRWAFVSGPGLAATPRAQITTVVITVENFIFLPWM